MRKILSVAAVLTFTAATLLCSLLYWLYRQPLEPTETRIEPGSTEEMELQLASGDEAG